MRNSVPCLILVLFTLVSFAHASGGQHENDKKMLASTKTTASTTTTHSETTSAVVYTELGPAHNTAFYFNPTTKSLRLIRKMPAFTTWATLYIKELSGKNVRVIKLNPRDGGGSEIELDDLLPGTYQYVLVLDSGRKIQDSFEWKE